MCVWGGGGGGKGSEEGVKLPKAFVLLSSQLVILDAKVLVGLMQVECKEIFEFYSFACNTKKKLWKMNTYPLKLDIRPLRTACGYEVAMPKNVQTQLRPLQ